MSIGANEVTAERTTTLISSIREDGGDLLWDMTITELNIVVEEGGQKKETKLGDASRPFLRLLLWTDLKGNVRDFDIDPVSVFFEKAKYDVAAMKKRLGGVIKKMMPRFPDRPVKQGDVLYTMNIGDLFESLLPKVKGLVGGEFSSRAAGFVTHEGRPHILGVYEGEFRIGKGGITVSGYELLDVGTGHRSYALFSAEGDSVVERDNVHLSIRGERVSNLPSATSAPVARQSTAPARGTETEHSLQIIKRLLDKGLITKDEAAWKRKSILKAL
jgi:hypothetical protein